jgi:uncharacterized protein (TIRG00374 family)
MTPGARRAILVPFVGLFLLCGWVYLTLDHQQLAQLTTHAHWRLVLLATACSFASYIFICFALLRIGRALGMHRAPAWLILTVTFVSLTLNHVISLGVAGYSARVLLLRRAGEAPGTILAASLLHSYLTTLVMVSLLPVGLGAIALSAVVHPAGIAALQLATVASTLAVVGMTVALLSRRVRLAVFRVIARVGRLLPGHFAEGLPGALEDLDIGLASTGRSIKERPLAALAPVGLTILDWIAVLASFWLCLEAVGQSVPLHVLIAGFAIGMNVGVVSLIPGGLGVQEGSQAGVLALFGVPFGPALLASVLFRFLYFLVPFIVSLPLYFLVLRPIAPTEDEVAPAPHP